MTASYPRKARQASASTHLVDTAQTQRHVSTSNVRPASTSLVTNRMDSLSFQMGRLSCSGLE
ncbi:hypothetical protein [Deinococcus aerophilus]|uniref:Uncharacterized protein n=1 Tax=Deinococcus aerophilus TaxID=522488 RepID=A0ABQ2GLY6_9DEIO|nr:hypothetical protein [Deinococcus aerophilus]GGM02668.1 hypothetical protein GCM10010841_09030 [Deinococcus aerophilus]